MPRPMNKSTAQQSLVASGYSTESELAVIRAVSFSATPDAISADSLLVAKAWAASNPALSH